MVEAEVVYLVVEVEVEDVAKDAISRYSLLKYEVNAAADYPESRIDTLEILEPSNPH